MTKRNNQFTAPASIPTVPVSQPKIEEVPVNPLTAFFRKTKLDLELPSRGNWYPGGSLELTKGKLPIFAMNANDDIRFRTGDVTMTGRNLYEVIQSCAPGIKEPENIPYIDVDPILLAIRAASYGDSFSFKVTVPNTTLIREITVSASALLKELSTRKDKWDDSIAIEDETGQVLQVTVHPIALRQVFATSKTIFQQRRALTKNLDSDQNIQNDEVYSSTLDTLANSAINLICSSIATLRVIGPDKKVQLELEDSEAISEAIHSMDIEYFNSIRTHIETQRQKYVFFSPEQISTEEEISAGADAKWTAELSFMSSSFLPTQ